MPQVPMSFGENSFGPWPHLVVIIVFTFKHPSMMSSSLHTLFEMHSHSHPLLCFNLMSRDLRKSLCEEYIHLKLTGQIDEQHEKQIQL